MFDIYKKIFKLYYNNCPFCNCKLQSRGKHILCCKSKNCKSELSILFLFNKTSQISFIYDNKIFILNKKLILYKDNSFNNPSYIHFENKLDFKLPIDYIKINDQITTYLLFS
jgi:hypothetical protein